MLFTWFEIHEAADHVRLWPYCTTGAKVDRLVKAEDANRMAIA
jgi:hypothetical protein